MADVPLAARMRPRTFEEFVGQSHLIGPGKALTQLLEGGHLPSIVLWGPAGNREDDPRLPARRRGRRPTRAAVGGLLGRGRRSEGDRAGQGRAVPDGAVRRRGPPVVEGAAGRPPAGGRGGDGHPGRRDHREPVLLARHAVAVALHPPAARTAGAGGAPRAARARPGRRGPRPGQAGRRGLGRGVRAPRRRRRRGRPGRAHRPGGRGPRGALGRGGLGHPRARGRRRPEEGDRLRPTGRRALRRDLGVHQEHPGVRPGRGPVLARPDAGGGRGCPRTSPGGWSCTRARTSAWPIPAR